MKLRSVIKLLQAHDPSGFYSVQCSKLDYNISPRGRYKLNDEFKDIWSRYAAKFKALAVIPSACIHFWNYSRKIKSLDACHLYGRFQGCCLMVTVIDAYDQNLTLGYCIVENENKEAWNWFASIICDLFEGCQLIISDRDKGLEEVKNYQNKECVFSNCSIHITANAGVTSASAKKAVTKLARSGNMAMYYQNLEKIRSTFGSNIATYLDNVREKFCFPFLQQRGLLSNYGQSSSNASEQQNASYSDFRGLAMTEGVIYFFNTCVSTFKVRRDLGIKSLSMENYVSEEIVKKVFDKGTESKGKGWRLELTEHDEFYHKLSFLVSVSTNRKTQERFQIVVKFDCYAENWYDRIQCSCGLFVLKGYPCFHAGHVLVNIRLEGFKFYANNPIWKLWHVNWYAPAYHTSNYVAQYSPRDFQLLEVDYTSLAKFVIFPPRIVARKGRPKQCRQTKRKLKENTEDDDYSDYDDDDDDDDRHGYDDDDPYNLYKKQEKPVHKCTGCGSTEHNIATCHNKNIGYMMSISRHLKTMSQLIMNDKDQSQTLMQKCLCTRYCNQLCYSTNVSGRQFCICSDVSTEVDNLLQYGVLNQIMTRQLTHYSKLKKFYNNQTVFRNTYNKTSIDAELDDAHYGMMNCSFCKFIHPKSYDASLRSFIHECPLDVCSYLHRTKSCVGKERFVFSIRPSKFLTRDNNSSIGDGLHANVEIPIGTIIAIYNGTHLEAANTEIVDRHRGYLINLNKDLYLDCFENRHNMKCFASIVNSACGLKDPCNNISPINNAELVPGNVVNTPYIRSTKLISPGQEILISYGRSFFCSS